MPEAVERKDSDVQGLQPADLGRYQVFATLGRGGMADVYLAVARGPMGFNKLVVIKRLRAHLAEEASFRDMFLDEARLAARLNHPNVIQSYEVGETNGSFFIAMEYLDGQPLNRVVAEAKSRGTPVDPGIAVRIVADALSGLSHAHDLRDYDGTPLKIIHRDVSPHNVFVTYEGQVKLVDFGIAKAALSRSETEVGVLKGKVAYMAPEQAIGGPIDGRADLFAMGIVLWELAAGRQLFSGENAANTLHRLLNEPVPAPSTVNPQVDPRLEGVILRALEKDPARRYQSARELREALESWLRESGKGARAEDVGKWVGSLFEEKRARVQREIQKQMSELSRPDSRAHLMSLTSIEQMERAGGNPTAQLANLSTDSGAGLVSGLDRKSQSTSMPSAIDASKRKKRMMIGGGAALAALGAIVAIALMTCGKGEAPPSATLAATATPAPDTASAAPAPPPAVTATSIPTPPATATVRPTPPAPAVAPAPAPRRGGGHGYPRPSPTPRPAPAPALTPSSSDGAPGFLTIDTYPWTRVSENGRALGTTPLVHMSLAPGAHVLMLENADQGLRQSYTVTIKSGETVTRRLGLK